jgi:hypothetical protein
LRLLLIVYSIRLWLFCLLNVFICHFSLQLIGLYYKLFYYYFNYYYFDYINYRHLFCNYYFQDLIVLGGLKILRFDLFAKIIILKYILILSLFFFENNHLNLNYLIIYICLKHLNYFRRKLCYYLRLLMTCIYSHYKVTRNLLLLLPIIYFNYTLDLNYRIFIFFFHLEPGTLLKLIINTLF